MPMTHKITLCDAVSIITELLDVALVAHLRRTIAVRRGQRAKLAEHDLRKLLEVYVPELMAEHEGIDGDLVWWLASKQLAHRRGSIQERLLMDDPMAREIFEDERVWDLFKARLATSPAGLTWDHLESRFPWRWS